MCGIVGSVGVILSEQTRKEALSIMDNRGPDGSGEWLSKKSSASAWMGHTRLAILDLSPTGSQPFLDSTGRWVLVFNGEIYNFLELKIELEASGYEFIGQSDTEVLLYGLIDQGIDFLLKCNGMWAFAFYDIFTKEMLLARDRFGKKPLYWRKNSIKNEYYFASEMKAIRVCDKDVLLRSDYLEFARNPFEYESSDQTIYENIYRIRPGHALKIKNNNVSEIRWWNTLDHLVDVPEKYSDQVKMWRELFLDSVRLRMRSDVSLGCALSGGLDSSGIFAAMALLSMDSEQRQSDDCHHGFNASFPGLFNDEYIWAQKVVESVGGELHKVEIDPLNGFWNFNDALEEMEDPYVTLPQPMLETYRAVRNSGVKVTLDGHGADELFSGYGHIEQTMLGFNLKFARSGYKVLCGAKAVTPTFLGFWKKWTLLNARYGLHKIKRRLISLNGSKNFSENINTHLDKLHPEYKKMTVFEKSLFDIFHYTTLPTILRNFDRYAMASGVEVRMPIMDWRLVVYTFSLPMESKVGNGYTKRIMRDALEGILVDEVRLRKDKMGFVAPVVDWLKGPLQSVLEEKDLLNALDFKGRMLIKDFKSNQNPNIQEGAMLFDLITPYIYRKALTGLY